MCSEVQDSQPSEEHTNVVSNSDQLLLVVCAIMIADEIESDFAASESRFTEPRC
jgi:hypothetical protein